MVILLEIFRLEEMIQVDLFIFCQVGGEKQPISTEPLTWSPTVQVQKILAIWAGVTYKAGHEKTVI